MQFFRWKKQGKFSRVSQENCSRNRLERPYFSSVSVDFGHWGSSRRGSKMVFFRCFRAVSFDNILWWKRKFSAPKFNIEVAPFRTKSKFLWIFCAPETAIPLLNWGKKTRLAPVVESLVSNAQTTIFLSKISEKNPLSETPKRQLFWRFGWPLGWRLGWPLRNW